MLATGEVPLVLTNERGELTVDPMTGLAMAGVSPSEGRPLPWLDVPGFTPPQVQARAAESIATMGIMTSLPMPTAEGEATSAEGTETAQPSLPQSQAPAAMPKSEDWDLPEGLGGNAFVPIEAD